jgi:hypothetical protein
VTLPGTAEKIIPSTGPEPEKAEIAIHKAEPLYQELRVANGLQGQDGETLRLKPGAHVDVTIEAAPQETTPTKDQNGD